MARYFWGNTLASFKRSSANVAEITTAGRFDSTFVPSAIGLPGIAGEYIETMPFVGVASVTELWLHFEVCTGSLPGTGQQFLSFYNSSGVEVFKLMMTSGGNWSFTPAFWNGATYTSLTASPGYATVTLYRFDLRIVCGASGTFELYNAGALVVSGSITSASCNNIASVRFKNPGTTTGPVISQVMGASFDTRDSRYKLDQPTAIGALTDGSGLIGDVTETVLDESTSWALPTAGQRRSATHAALTVPSGYQIGAVCLSARGRTNGTGPTDGKLGLRKTTAGLNYSSSALALNTGYEPRGAVWEADPGTASAWTQAGYNDAQMFAEAA